MWVKGVAAPESTVRGKVWNFVSRHIDRLSPLVLEVGSRLPASFAWWANFRTLRPDLQPHDWYGIDLELGPHVDLAWDLEADDIPTGTRYGGVLCAETLEHFRRPWVALERIHKALLPGATGIFTTLFSFPVHGYPNDYWRFTPQCLEELLIEAGFHDVVVEEAGHRTWYLSDHDPDCVETREVPVHVFATGIA